LRESYLNDPSSVLPASIKRDEKKTV
jgi:hypothetical protein